MTKFNRRGGRFRRYNIGGRKYGNRCHQGESLRKPKKFVKPSNCVECDKVAPLYKCPVCLKKYCSVVCYKEHTMRCSSTASSELNDTTASNPSKNENDASKRVHRPEFPPEDVVPLETLMRLKSDDRILTLLKSSKLRMTIKKLDSMRNPSNFFCDFMKNAEFRAFSNVSLEVVGMKNEYNMDD